MKETLLKVYVNHEEKGNISVGHLFITEIEDKNYHGKKEVISYIPTGNSWNTRIDAYKRYNTYLECLLDLQGKRLLLQEKDHSVLKELCYKEYKEAIADILLKDGTKKKYEDEDNDRWYCDNCGEELIGGMLSPGNGKHYCMKVECVRVAEEDPAIKTLPEHVCDSCEEEEWPEDMSKIKDDTEVDAEFKKLICRKCSIKICEDPTGKPPIWITEDDSTIVDDPSIVECHDCHYGLKDNTEAI